MLRTDALDYHLPADLIATTPAQRREDARLLVCSRRGAELAHSTIRDLPEWLRAGDLLVLNTSKVVPARLLGQRSDTGGRVQMLYLRGSGGQWEALVRAKRLKPGMLVDLAGNQQGQTAQAFTASVELIERLGVEGEPNAEAGAWRVRSEVPVESILAQAGLPPLPPYILSARQQRGEGGGGADSADDSSRYQTVYAKVDGSVAAPTAGLHFTEPLLDALRAKGVRTAEVILHVGTGTFKPVETEHVEQHPMHAEVCSVSAEVIEAIRSTREQGGRVIAVGTTTARALESYAALMVSGNPPPAHPAHLASLPERLETSILIAPGHHWQWVDGLLTNFHLPRSTLLAMVGSLFGEDASGIDRLLHVYAEAIAHRYRFYSYGDAMLVLE